MDVNRVILTCESWKNLDSDLKLTEPREKGSLRRLWLLIKAFEILTV